MARDVATSRKESIMSDGTFDSCVCASCVDACRKKPGWFLPEQIEPLARALNVSVSELFETKLAIDYFVGDDEKQYVLAPATRGGRAGDMYPFDPYGECVFLDDELCSIHDTGEKPYECKVALACSELALKDALTHGEVAERWAEHSELIEQLYGREPQVAEPEISDLFSLLFGMAGMR